MRTTKASRTSTRPLTGLTVVVTRPRDQAEGLSARLRARGAHVVEAPTIRIEDPPDRGPLLRAVERLESYDWLVFTSVNGVQRFGQALRDTGREPRLPRGARVAAIGPATAAAVVGSLGISTPLVPESYRAESLVRAILSAAASPEASGGVLGGPPGDRGMLSGDKVLLSRAAEARSVLPDRLRAAGAELDEVAAYVTVPETGEAETLRRLVAAGEIDWITFTSSSTVRSYVELVGPETGGGRVAAIGPITAATARRLGMPVRAVATEYTIPGLVRALESAVAGEAVSG